MTSRPPWNWNYPECAAARRAAVGRGGSRQSRLAERTGSRRDPSGLRERAGERERESEASVERSGEERGTGSGQDEGR